MDYSGWIELFKWVLREHSEAQAIQAAAVLQRGLIVDLDSRLTHARTHFSGCTLCKAWKWLRTSCTLLLLPSLVPAEGPRRTRV